MDISLRRAAALSRALLETAKQIEIKTTETISVFEPDPVSKRAALLEKLNASVQRASALISAAYDLREQIGSANARNGVNSLLTLRAVLEAKEKFTRAIAEAEPQTAASLLTGQIENIKARSASAASYYGHDEVVAPVVDASMKADYQDMLQNIRRDKTDIADRLAELNATTKITLNEDVEDVLRREKLI